MPDPIDEQQALEFYYYGFYDALKRFRSTALLGWVIAAVGAAVLLFGWEVTRHGGIIELALSLCGIAGGLIVVHVAVTGLSVYVGISFPRPGSGGTDLGELFEDLRALMVDVSDGGWREALEALAEIEAAGKRAGLPPPGTRSGAARDRRQN